MEIGMLWFDNDKQVDFTLKVERAVSYYQKKYGRKPNLCYVHPTMMNPNVPVIDVGINKSDTIKFTNLKIKGSINILPNHFWIGIEKEKY